MQTRFIPYLSLLVFSTSHIFVNKDRLVSIINDSVIMENSLVNVTSIPQYVIHFPSNSLNDSIFPRFCPLERIIRLVMDFPLHTRDTLPSNEDCITACIKTILWDIVSCR